MRPFMVGVATALSLVLGVAASAPAQTTPPKPEEKKPATSDPKKSPPPATPAKPADKKAPAPAAKPPEKKAPAPAKSAPAPVEEPKTPGKPFSEWNRLTEGFLGDTWNKLDDAGFKLRVRYQNDYTRLQKGGIKPHNHADRYRLDVVGAFDLEKAGLEKGMRLTAAYWQMGGENGTADAGSIHHISPLESDSRKELGEFYFEWDDFVPDMRLKIGKMDGSVDFAAAALGADFMSMGGGYPPNILGYPSWPESAFGGTLHYEPDQGAYVQVGAFDGAAAEGKRTGERGIGTAFGEPAGASFVAETGLRSKRWGRPVKMGVGAWHHTSDRVEFDGGASEQTGGWYALLEGQLVRHDRRSDSDPRGLWLMARFSAADEEVQAIEREYAAALVWKGVCNARPKDSIGLAWLQGDLSDEAGAGFMDDFEQVVEGYYKAQLTNFCSASAGVQQIWNPGGVHPNALVFGLRLVVDF